MNTIKGTLENCFVRQWDQNMFQTCLCDKRIYKKEHCYIFKTFAKCNDWEHQNTMYS